jgi:Tfp pilus assembly protein PilZ
VGAFGAFVETDNVFPVAEEVLLIFTLPNHPEPFHVSGDIVWSGPQGFGARFKYLTRNQLKIIRTFSEKEMDVYEINT